jgi:5-methylcytosine-specific restriction endonuclease McrA
MHKKRKCEVCGVKLGRFEGDIHHKIPIIMGGTNRFSNLMLVCENCHKKIHEDDDE